MTDCPSCQNPDIKSAADKVAEAKSKFNTMMTGSKAELTVLQELIDQALNGTDQAKLYFKRRYNAEKHNYDVWQAVSKELERFAWQARRRYSEKRDEEKFVPH